jgi:SpoVK/Ycf46/Vps4 family AAA+-type ATPase
MSEEQLASLRRAVEAAPTDIQLRLLLAELLVEGGVGEEAVAHLGVVLQQEPTSTRARELMSLTLRTDKEEAASQTTASAQPDDEDPPREAGSRFDWAAAESQVDSAVGPMFVGDGGVEQAGQSPVDAWDVERSTVTLADVGGMEEVKQRLEASFLAPMRNPDLSKAYGMSLRGGLMLYGPPGCGKTFLAKAVAGELGARFLSVGLSDVLDMYVGRSERNVADLFALARRSAPCVLFLDEIDALGQRRSQTRMSGMRTTVNQLLSELDGISSSNEGVFVLAATNHPWDVDVALRRPGRLDRTLLVLPPDEDARVAILGYHLRDRLVEGVDLRRLARATEGWSGADLEHLTETAAETVLMEASRTGEVRPIRQYDLEAALGQLRPSIGPWFETARNVALFANEGGQYDDLLRYLKKRRLA